MKYLGMKNTYGVFSVVIFAYSIINVFGFCSRWPDVTKDIHVLMIVIQSLLFWFGLYVLYRFLRRTSYAMILDDGIHIFSRKKEELTFIPWESVKECKLVRAEGRFAYLMLIFQYDATYAKKPVALYKPGQRPTYKEVWQHRMDECMDKLSRGKLTEKEFKQIPYLLLAPSKNHLFEYCLEMWKAIISTEKKI